LYAKTKNSLVKINEKLQR